MKNRFLATTALAGLAFFAATPAFANCNDHSPTTGDTVTCAVAGGDDSTGVGGSGISNLTVNVDDNARIDVIGVDGITVGDGSVTLGADAYVRSQISGQGIHANGGALTTIILGTSSSVIAAGYGILLDDDGDITVGNLASVTGNNGTAILTNSVSAGSGSVVRISSGATVTGGVTAGTSSNDSLHWVQDAAGSFNTDDVGAGQTYQNFEHFYKDGASTTTLTGTNGFDWNVTAGTLSADDVQEVNNVDIATGSSFEFNTATGTYSHDITGAGTFTIVDGSTITLTGDNSGHTGLLSILLNDNVTVGSQSALGAGDISIDESTLTFSSGFEATNNIDIGLNDAILDTGINQVVLSGDITGAVGHDIGKVGAGTLSLTGDNSAYAGGITVSEGTLDIGSANALGTGQVTIDGGTLSASTPGAGALTNAFVIGAGGATFDTTSHSFGLGSSSTLSGAGDITVNGSSNFTFGGTSTLSGGITVDHSAIGAINTASLGDNSSTNIITLDGGTLVVGFTTDLIAQKIAFATDGGTLYSFMSDQTATFSGAMTGNNTIITKDGSGAVNLNGDLSGLTGTEIDVNTGLLSFNNSGAGNGTTVLVDNGATVGGNGHVGILEALSGGTIAPGNSIGTLHVNALAVFDAGSHYAIEYNDAGASDLLIAGGNISVDSGAILDLTGASGTYADSSTYTILQSTGGTITGTFGTVNNNLAFLDATQHNNTTDFTITLDRNDVTFSDPTKNATQAGTADAVNDLGAGNDLFDAFTGLATDDVPTAAESISGAGNVSILPIMISSLTNPVSAHIQVSAAANNGDTHVSDNSDPSVYTAAYISPAAGAGPVDDNLSLWLQAIGGFGRTDSSSQAPGQKRTAYGAVGGIDRAFADSGLFGLYGGYQRGEVYSNSVGASADLNSFMLGAYAAHPLGGSGFNLSGGVSGIYHDVDTVRHVIVGGTSFSPHGDTDGDTVTAYAELARPFQFPDATVTGFGNLSVTRNHMNGYTEHDGGAANLVTGDVTQTNPATTLGVRTEQDLGALHVGASFGWQHTFGDLDPDATMHFVGGTTEFNSVGTPIARDSAVVDLNASANLQAGGKAYVGYDGTLARDAQDHSFKVGVKWDF